MSSFVKDPGYAVVSFLAQDVEKSARTGSPAPFPRACPYGCGNTVIGQYVKPHTKYICTECGGEVRYVDF